MKQVNVILVGLVLVVVGLIFFRYEQRRSKGDVSVPGISTELGLVSDENVKESYIVVKGDSLWKISVSRFGDGYRWVDIWENNKKIIRNPDKIYPEMELMIDFK